MSSSAVRSRPVIARTMKKTLRYFVTISGMVVVLVPFLWMVSASLGSLQDAFSLPPRWIPRSPSLIRYREVIQAVNISQFMLNSLKISTLLTAGQLLLSSMAGFAFARLRFPGSRVLFALLIASMMIPVQVTIVPLFIVMSNLGLIDSHASLILPGLATGFGIFLMRQFFLTIPRELAESARIDGAGNFTIFGRIFMPNATAGLSALAVFTFIGSWNELLRPLIFLNSQSKKTLPMLMLLLRGNFGGGHVGQIMAGATLAILPVFVVFLLAQRRIVEGIATTGIKG